MARGTYATTPPSPPHPPAKKKKRIQRSLKFLFLLTTTSPAVTYRLWSQTPEERKSLSRVRLFATSWTVAYQAPLSMGFSRQQYWSGLPFPSSRGSSRPRD